MLYKLTTPLSFKDIAPLRCGDEVLLSGTIITARDKAHAYLVQCALNNKALPQRPLRTENLRRDRATGSAANMGHFINKAQSQTLPFALDGACLYHCGPLVTFESSAKPPFRCNLHTSAVNGSFKNHDAQESAAKDSNLLTNLSSLPANSQKKPLTAKIIAAGPTTSSRMEPYMAEIIRRYGVRMIIGKGGMDDGTRKALRKRAVYCSAVGGAAQVLAQTVQRIENVFGLKEFGETEAFWLMRVENFPIMVTMDAHGGSLHEDVQKNSFMRLKELLKK